MTVFAATSWTSNAEMIEDVARLGYLRQEWRTLDPTFGRGTFWKKWRPHMLTCHDLKTDGVDFRNLPHPSRSFDAVAFDPPYKLNGTPTVDVDGRYGVDVITSWQGRHQLIREGLTECARVLERGGILLLKCQDQVCSGHIRWQTDEFTAHAQTLGLHKIDRFEYLGSRPQPQRTRADGKPSVQQHARRNMSTLLVFTKLATA